MINKWKYLKIVLCFSIIILIVIGVLIIKLWPQNKAANLIGGQITNEQKSNFHSSGFFEFRDLVEKSMEEAKKDYKGKGPDDTVLDTQIGITSHHIPTAISLISKFYVTLLNSHGPRDVFVILGPDHRETGFTPISTTNLPYITPFGELEIDSALTNELLQRGVALDTKSLEGEHSIGIQTIFIKLNFPQAKIVPIILKTNADENKINEVAEVLSRWKERITLIASVDFSHYQNYEYAKILDKESMEMLKNFNSSGFTLKHTDSPSALKLIIKTAQLSEANKILILDSVNSFDFTKNPENTTGYINAVFTKKDIKTLIFVGDMMLSRHVGGIMKKENNWQWPFLKIADYLKEADLLCGNLEGPITDKIISRGNMVFGADPRAAEGLKYAGFDIISLANNHTGDQGKEGMEDTFRTLKENSIDYIGAGRNESEAYSPVIKEINGVEIAFLAYTESGFTPDHYKATETRPGVAFMDVARMQKDVELVRQEVDLVIVLMHSGVEYASRPTSLQIEFAHAAIDAGTDLVVGHHPHIVQEIERYKNKYIAYSLGNFVFDQKFSDETMRGLILEVTIEGNEIKEVKSIDYKISESFQPEIIKPRISSRD